MLQTMFNQVEMQRRPLLVFLLFFWLCNVSAQWAIKHLNETSWFYENILKFRDDSLGLCMGDHSVILKTEDAGETWEAREPDINVNFRDFQFVSDSLVYAVGESRLVKSSDAGDTWHLFQSINGKRFNSLWFFSSDTGFVAGYDGIYRTVDGCSTWDTAWSITQSGYKYGVLKQMNFPTAQIGYAVGFGRNQHTNPSFDYFLLKSIDSGASWVSIKTFPDPPESVCFINRDTGFVGTESGDIYKTSDGGSTWTGSQLAEYGIPVKSIQFISEMKGFAAGGFMVMLLKDGIYSNFLISETADGGETWKSYDTTGIALNSVWFVNDTLGFVSGDLELIMKSNGITDQLPGDYPWYLFGGGSIEQKKLPDSRISIHPNPTDGILFVRNMDSDRPIESIRLLSVSGQTIDITDVVSNKDLIQLDLSGLRSGIYFLRIIFADNMEGLKIIKQ